MKKAMTGLDLNNKNMSNGLIIGFAERDRIIVF